MSKLVILKIGAGDFNSGFPVTLRIESDGTCIAEIDGQLPPAPMIPEQYSEWRAKYSDRGLGFRVLEAVEGQVKNISVVELAADLQNSLNQWLLGREFIPIKEGLLDNLNITDNILFIIKAQDQLLQRLPWHLCDFFERYHNAEVVISNPYQPIPNPSKRLKEQVRILVILGVDSDINVQADLDILKDKLPDAEIVHLIATTREQLNNQLWEQEWDILFFAGHSCSDFTDGQGRFYINDRESITIKDLKYGLRNAIKKGLKLAIFNSCDGLGLAQGLADLQMPAIVVMRERVPDGAAQKFLEYFLQAFAVKEMSLYASVREARERLCGLENLYPCASWLPVLCQHANAEPLTWIGLREIEDPEVQEKPSVFNKLANHVIKHKVLAGILILLGLMSCIVVPPVTSNVLNRIGAAKLNANQLAGARLYFSWALKFNPNNSKALASQGILDDLLGENEAARDNFRASKSKADPSGCNNAAFKYLEAGQYEKAKPLFPVCMNLAKREDDQIGQYYILKNWGWLNLKQKEYEEAAKNLQDAIKLIPDEGPANCLLAQALEAKDSLQESLVEWKNCRDYARDYIPEEVEWKKQAQQRLAVRLAVRCNEGTGRCYRGDGINPDDLHIITPRNGTLLFKKNPKIRWHSVKNATNYIVRVSAIDMNWETSVTDTSVLYEGPSLQPGKNYLITVEANNGESSEETFTMLSKDETDRVKKEIEQLEQQSIDNEEEKALALADLYEKHNLFAEAIDTLEALRDSQNVEVYHQLSKLYKEMELFYLANEIDRMEQQLRRK